MAGGPGASNLLDSEAMITPPPQRSSAARDAQFRSLAENASEPIITIDADDHVIFANAAAARVFGYPLDELERMAFTSLIPERFRARHRAGMQRYLRSGERRLSWDGIELVGLRRDGSEVPLEVTFGEYASDGQRYFSGIMRDITARQAADKERVALLERERHARLEAQAANRAKSEFLATMSHEIRTPINAIIGYTDLLIAEISGQLNEAQRSHLARIQVSSEHLITLIGDILDLAKVEAGRMRVEHECHDVGETADAALTLVREQARRRGIRLENQCAMESQLEYYGDSDRVRQILVNLLSNAVKFTEPGGSVTVTCSQQTDTACDATGAEDGCVFITVEDTGIGMSEDELARVFDPFVQASSGLTRERGGTGLGLTISRQLARLMDGDLTAVSTPGAGSRFTLRLPRSPSAVAPPDEALLAGLDVGDAALAAVGDVLQLEIDAIVEAYVQRLQTDGSFPTEALSSVDIEDHAATLLADVGQALIILGKSGQDAQHLLRDGTRIQSIIAELHGAQRARLMWLEPALEREWDVLWEELERGVRGRLGERPGLEVGLAAMHRMIDYARHVSLRAWRQFERP